MNIRELARKKRHARLRKKVSGTPDMPRLNVFRSLNHIYAQIIDDTTGRTLASASTLDKEFKEEKGHKGNISMAKKVGSLIALRALQGGITRIVLDKGGFKYHGSVKAFAEAAREGGLKF